MAEDENKTNDQQPAQEVESHPVAEEAKPEEAKPEEKAADNACESKAETTAAPAQDDGDHAIRGMVFGIVSVACVITVISLLGNTLDLFRAIAYDKNNYSGKQLADLLTGLLGTDIGLFVPSLIFGAAAIVLAEFAARDCKNAKDSGFTTAGKITGRIGFLGGIIATSIELIFFVILLVILIIGITAAAVA